VNLLDFVHIPSGHEPCLCDSGRRYRDCCREAVNAWADRRLVEYEFLVNGRVVSPVEGERRLGEPGVAVRPRLFPPLERHMARRLGPYQLPIGEDANALFRYWLDDHLAEDAPGEDTWESWWAAFEEVAQHEDIWVTEVGARIEPEVFEGPEQQREDLWRTGAPCEMHDPGLTLLDAFSHPVRRHVLVALAQGPANAAMIAREIKVTTPHAAYHLTELREAGVVERVPPATKPVRHRVPDRLARDGIFRTLLAIAAPDRTPRGFFVELGPYVDELYSDAINQLMQRVDRPRASAGRDGLPALPAP
jgi:DNA-binding transcriptional ArsR family regulator